MTVFPLCQQSNNNNSPLLACTMWCKLKHADCEHIWYASTRIDWGVSLVKLSPPPPLIVCFSLSLFFMWAILFPLNSYFSFTSLNYFGSNFHCERETWNSTIQDADVKLLQVYKPVDLQQLPRGGNPVKKEDCFIAVWHIIPNSTCRAQDSELQCSVSGKDRDSKMGFASAFQAGMVYFCWKHNCLWLGFGSTRYPPNCQEVYMWVLPPSYGDLMNWSFAQYKAVE